MDSFSQDHPLESFQFVFEQIGEDFHQAQFVARPEGDPMEAFTFELKGQIPTTTVRLRREKDWARLYSELKGPDICLMEFGPQDRPGWLAYGITSPRPMIQYLNRPSHSSSSIYFLAQNDREYKWKVGPNSILQCVDVRTNRWVAEYDPGYEQPQMRIRDSGVLISTELFTTWFLYQKAKQSNWNILTPREIKERNQGSPSR